MTQENQELVEKIRKVIENQPIPPHYNPKEYEGKRFNCYAYAMRMCVNLSDRKIRPGIISKGEETSSEYSKRQVLRDFKKDCKMLGLRVTSSDLREKIGTNEYKIAVYVKPGADFHFARQDSNGAWSEKNGWYRPIEILKEEDVTKDEDGYEFIGIFKVSKK